MKLIKTPAPLFCALVILFISISSRTESSENSKEYRAPGTGSASWIGVGKSTYSVSNPKGTFGPSNGYIFDLGVEMKMAGPLFFTLGINFASFKGTLQYDYTGADTVRYQDSGIHFTHKITSFSAGLKFRIVNISILHFFVAGGGFGGSSTFQYDVASDPTISNAGSQFITKESSIRTLGYYGDGGIDIISSLKTGSGGRFGYRTISGSTAPVHGVANQKVNFQNGCFYLAYLHQL